MKTKEFIEKIEEWGYQIEDIKDCFSIKLEMFIPSRLAVVSHKEMFIFDTFYPAFSNLNEEEQKELFDLIVEYSSTPIEDRKEEKKYKIKHKFLKNSNGKEAYCWKSLSGNFIDSDRVSDIYTGAYTQKEIEEIKEKYNVSLDDFEFIEIKED